MLDYVIMWGPLALIIIFQPEIRNALEQLGKKQILTRHRSLTLDEREKVVYEIMNSIDYLRKSRIGGLIVIERDIKLKDIVDTGFFYTKKYYEFKKPVFKKYASECVEINLNNEELNKRSEGIKEDRSKLVQAMDFFDPNMK